MKELKDSNGGTWKDFVQALKEEYFMEDFERVTKRSFLEWIARPRKDLSANELLREFECQFVQLSGMERLTLELEKIELFIQAADIELQEKLEPLLEDQNEERGLKSDWKKVEKEVSRLTKRQRQKDKEIVSNIIPLTTMLKQSISKPSSNTPKNENLAIEELIKGMRELNLKLARLEEKGQILEDFSGAKTRQMGERLSLRCMWCNSLDH